MRQARFASKHMFKRARALRKEGTPEEETLWELVRDHKLGVPIRRQHPIGSFIVDFYCPRAKLAIELDGAHHDPARDAQRDAVLAKRGVLVMRFENHHVRNRTQDVLNAIQEIALKRVAVLSNK